MGHTAVPQVYIQVLSRDLTCIMEDRAIEQPGTRPWPAASKRRTKDLRSTRALPSFNLHHYSPDSCQHEQRARKAPPE